MPEIASQDPVSPLPPPIEAYPAPVQGWSAAFVLSFLYILSLLDRNIMVLLSEPVARDLGLSDFQLSLLYGPGFALLFAIAGLPLGWAIDRYSRRVVIWSGVLFWSLATMACGLGRNFGELLTARAGVGVGEAALVPGSQSILADMFPPARLALPLSIYGLGGKIGGGLSFMIGGMLIMLIPTDSVYQIMLIGQIKGWQLIFIVAGLPGIVLCFAMFLIPEPARRRVSRPDGSGRVTFGDYYRYVEKNARFIVNHHLAIITTMIVATGMTAWTPTFFSRVHGWDAAQTGFWLGMVLLIGPIISIPLHGLSADWLYRKGRGDGHLLQLKLALTLALVPGVLAYLVPNAWLALVLIGLAYALLVAYTGLFPSALQNMVPGDMRGKAASIALLLGGIGGMALGPVLVAFLTENLFGSPDDINLSLALCVGLGLSITIVLLSLAQKPMRDAAVTLQA